MKGVKKPIGFSHPFSALCHCAKNGGNRVVSEKLLIETDICGLMKKTGCFFGRRNESNGEKLMMVMGGN